MFNVFLTIFLFANAIFTLGALGLINTKITDAIKNQQEFNKSLRMLLEVQDKDTEFFNKSLMAKIDRILEFEDHNMDFLIEVRDEVRKPAKKAGKKKKAEATVETREDLEQL